MMWEWNRQHVARRNACDLHPAGTRRLEQRSERARVRAAVKAALHRLHSPDVYDLPSWKPEADFGILVQLFVGTADRPGEESFDLTLCTPGWLAARVGDEGIINARHHLVVGAYDYAQLERYLSKRVASCEGVTWDEVAAKLGRLGHWEFEDYREFEGYRE